MGSFQAFSHWFLFAGHWVLDGMSIGHCPPSPQEGIVIEEQRTRNSVGPRVSSRFSHSNTSCYCRFFSSELSHFRDLEVLFSFAGF